MPDYMTQERECPGTENRLNSLVTNTDNRPDNVDLMIVRRLAFKGIPLSISPNAYDYDHRLIENNVAIEARSKNENDLFWKMIGFPESRALRFAIDANFGEPDVSKCNWRNKTKMRIKALYWENKAKYWEDPTIIAFKDKAKEAREKSVQLLPKGSHLPTLKELRRLTNRVVDKAIASAQ